MDKVKALIKSELFTPIFLLVLISALAYLPFVGRFTYFNDDWYEMFAAGARGPQVFHDLFAIDRPGRADLMIPLYVLFGRNPLPYNISAYLFRLLGGLFVLWMLRLVWPAHKQSATLAALFFLIYPGFLSQPNAIDFQSHIAGVFFAAFSIALTLKAVLTKDIRARILLSIVSILFGLAYLSQMEYYAGFEVVRFVLLFLLAAQTETGWLARSKKTILRYLPFAFVPVVFFTWRLFAFHSLRKATDLGVQIINLASSPLHTIAIWLVGLVQSIADVVMLAWGVPLYNEFSVLTPAEMLVGLGVAACAVVLALVFLARMPLNYETNIRYWHRENLWAGSVMVAGGMIPIIVADRGVSFPDYSRYTLVSLIGAVLILVVLIDQVRSRQIQLGLVSLFVSIAILTHFANSLFYAHLADSYRTFWWQVTWRIPQIEPGTTVVANYPTGVVAEDYFIWGPANLIYYPESQNKNYAQPTIYAAVPNHETLNKVLMQVRQEYNNRRSIRTYASYRNILLLTQPTPDSCMQVINGRQLEFSSSENESVMLMGPFSEPQHIIAATSPPLPPQPVFGIEPMRDWCYYYEKADFARQMGDWQTVINLGEEVAKLRLSPSDKIEWIPFLQAYAHFGNQLRLKELMTVIASDPFVVEQACRILTGMGLEQSTHDFVQGVYCLPN